LTKTDLTFAQLNTKYKKQKTAATGCDLLAFCNIVESMQLEAYDRQTDTSVC